MNPVNLANVWRARFARGEFHRVAAYGMHSVAKVHQHMACSRCIAGCHQKIEIDLPAQCAVRNRFRCERDSFQQCEGDALPAHGATDGGCLLKERRSSLAILHEVPLEAIQDRLGHAAFQSEFSEPIEEIECEPADIKPIQDPSPVAFPKDGEACLHFGSRAPETGKHGLLQSSRPRRRFGFESEHWGHIDQWLYISGSPRLPGGGRWRR